MKRCYADLYALTSEPVRWWDELGVPRWRDFHPSALDIYASEALLMTLDCQSCGFTYKVALCSQFQSAQDVTALVPRPREFWTLSEEVLGKEVNYGDPPRLDLDCCPHGSSMTAVPRTVLEFWRRHRKIGEWVRVPTLEIDVTPTWFDPPESIDDEDSGD